MHVFHMLEKVAEICVYFEHVSVLIYVGIL